MDLLQAMKRDIRITEYAQMCGFTVLRAGAEFTLKEHDSVRIDPEKNLFIRNADKRQAGSIIDFVMWMDSLGQQQAIQKLRGMMDYGASYHPRPPLSRGSPIKKELQLPQPAEGKHSRVFAYLNKTRGIDYKTITEMMKRKMLYEDDHHNCVFVGRDYDGTAAFATKRSTMTDAAYRGDAAGSRKEVGFFVDNKATALFVTEAPIDAMSIMSMLRANDRDPGGYSYLALCGVSEKALTYHISRPENSGITRVYLATDNDEAGNLARGILRQSLKSTGFQGQIIDKLPAGKDWNDDLLCLTNSERRQQQKPENKRFTAMKSEQQTLERGMEL